MNVEVVSRVVRELVATGGTQRSVAEVLGVSPATVSRHARREANARPPGRPRGWPGFEACVQVLREIRSAGGHVTDDALKRRFPDVPRSLIRAMIGRVRKRLRSKRRQHLQRLRWTQPGTVWAMDFTALDGRDGEHALCIRDIASTRILHVGVVERESAAEVVLALVGLFAAHGPPLVIKMDNGAAFLAATLRDLLASVDVLPLYSPPRTPRYNGCCEVGNRQVKRVAADLRVVDDEDSPLGEYLDSARQVMDEQLVGRGRGAPTRMELWQERPMITSEQRRELRGRYQEHERAARASQGIAPDAALAHAGQASLDRHAIRDALCDMELLMIRRP